MESETYGTNPLQGEIDRLRKEAGRLQKRLKQAELVKE
jgi:hypothetical protein